MSVGHEVGLVLESAPGDGSFVDHAVRALASLGVDSERVAVAVGPDTVPDPTWRAMLAHGAGLGGWAATWAGGGRTVALTDWPEGELVRGVSYVDWGWWEAGYAVGFAAARAGIERLAVVAGPAVATQRRVAKAARQGFADGGGRDAVVVRHLKSFQDVTGALRAAAELGAGDDGIVLVSAGAASGVLAEAVTRSGWRVAGFGSSGGSWTLRIASDVAGGVERLLTGLLAAELVPHLLSFGSQSGLLRVMVGEGGSPHFQLALESAFARLTDPELRARLTDA